VAYKLLCLFSGVGVGRSAFSHREKRHGAPAAWLGAKGTYPICPMLRRRYLAPLSFSRCSSKARAGSSGKGDAAFQIRP